MSRRARGVQGILPFVRALATLAGVPPVLALDMTYAQLALCIQRRIVADARGGLS